MASIDQISLLNAANAIERGKDRANGPIVKKQKDVSDGIADYLEANNRKLRMRALSNKQAANSDTKARLKQAAETAKILQDVIQDYRNLGKAEKDSAKEAFKERAGFLIKVINSNTGAKAVAPSRDSQASKASGDSTGGKEQQEIALQYLIDTVKLEHLADKDNWEKVSFKVDELKQESILEKKPEDIFNLVQKLGFAVDTMENIIDIEAAQLGLQESTYQDLTKFSAKEKADASREAAENKARHDTLMKMFAQSIRDEKAYHMLIAKMVSDS